VKRVIAFVAAGLIVAVAVVTGIVVTYGVLKRPPAGEPMLFAVKSGESFSRIRDRLEAAQLVEHSRSLALYALLRRYDRHVKAGTYMLTPGDRPKDILAKMVRGDVHKVSVTIPEGFMHWQIAGLLDSEANVDSSLFAGLIDDGELLAEFDIDAPSVEGYLFPDTYVFPWEVAPREIAKTMITRLNEVFDETMRVRADDLGLTRVEVLTLASIVEAETRLSEERPLVSAVYHNRLRQGMRLEADPTVAYAMGGYKGRLFYRDLEIDSPYNTYKYEGLPPGPICSPGKAAILAALFPDSTTNAMYFVAEGDGGHIFSRTLSEHLAAVRRVRETRTSQD